VTAIARTVSTSDVLVNGLFPIRFLLQKGEGTRLDKSLGPLPMASPTF